MGKIIVGRETEQAILKERYSSEKSEFIAITGRRRVGKTYLVNTYFENEMSFHFSGGLNASLSQQLQGFHYQYCAFFKSEILEKVPANWMDAFILLSRQLDKSRKKSKKVIFIDELPWLDTHKSNFLGALEWFWNSWAINKNVLLIVCGSATSWMINKIVNNKGGLHNRLTQRIHLLPFTLKESIDFLKHKKIKLSTYQITQLYMAMGGIPHYLNEIKTGESAIQSIERICFQKDGLLVNEFDNLYRALFKNSENHLKIVFALAKKLKGFSRKELIEASKLKDGGAFSEILEELTWCNFITATNGYGKAKKDSIYRLTDEFSLFYLKFMYRKNNVNWLQLASSTQWKAWTGYAFENLCFKHLTQIKKRLGIEGVYTELYSFQSLGNKSVLGAQIDLLIDRNDGIINLCEIKFYDQKYTLTKSESQKIQHRIEVFKRITKTKKTIFPTLITTFGAIDNEHKTGFIQQEISLENLMN
jgi:AAA+ ATPase superfamily predicted ATPase